MLDVDRILEVIEMVLRLALPVAVAAVGGC